MGASNNYQDSNQKHCFVIRRLNQLGTFNDRFTTLLTGASGTILHCCVLHYACEGLYGLLTACAPQLNPLDTDVAGAVDLAAGAAARFWAKAIYAKTSEVVAEKEAF